MCIAVIKPKGVKMPNQPTLKNCFTSNPHGAGFMYSNGEELVIKKGFMTFKDFYDALINENISDDKLVFLHFRIATHGLKDGGNTHPFPVTTNVQELRSVQSHFNGYGMIHNGVIHYDVKKFYQYDPTGVISDTMLFSMILAESIKDILNKKVKDLRENAAEKMIAYNLLSHKETATDFIESSLSWNKVAIMDVQENFIKYGDWIEDNGMFYSNSDYKDDIYSNYGGWGSDWCDSYSYFQPHNNSNQSSFRYCCCCEALVNKSLLKETIYGYACDRCVKDFELIKCTKCGLLAAKEDYDFTNSKCVDCGSSYCCDKCGKVVSYLRSCGEKLYCNSCFEEVFEEENSYSY